jgi:crossover junction endodeoxyribonuclease RusA
MIELRIDMKIVSVANLRMHWAVKARLAKSQRQKAFNALASVATPPPLPLTLVLTRIAPRQLDGDNLQSAFKATRDGVADWLGVDDGHKQLDWQYRQRSGGAKVYAVELEVI